MAAAPISFFFFLLSVIIRMKVSSSLFAVSLSLSQGHSEVIPLLTISLGSKKKKKKKSHLLSPATVKLTSPILIEGEISEPLLSEVVIWIMTNLRLT